MVVRACRAVDAVLTVGVDETVGGGEVGALLDLLGLLDTGHAAAVALTDRIERGKIAHDAVGMSLEGLLAFRSRMTFGDRRTLVNVAEVLRTMPWLQAAFRGGQVGWAQVRAITAEVRSLPVAVRAKIDIRFVDLGWVDGMDPDQLVDVIGDDAARLRPDLANNREVRKIESRFLHIQPALDGALTGYFELDPEAGATFLEGLETVTDQPTNPNNPNGPGGADKGPDGADKGSDGPDRSDGADDGWGGSDGWGVPGWADPVEGRSRARQRADGLVRLAEYALAGTRTDGVIRRARVRMNVVADIATLTGDDQHARAARLLWQTVGAHQR